jgi:hypothetical protein
MVVSDEIRDLVGARTHVAVLSSETFAKQRRNHPELTIADYRQLPEVGAAPDLIFRQDDRRVIFTRQADGRWLKAAVKVTADGDEMFVTSFQWARAREIQRLKKRYPLIWGEITAALGALIATQAAREAADDDQKGDEA